MRRILVPTDFSATADKAVHYALQIAYRANAEIFLLHVHTPIESPFIETEEVRRKYNEENELSIERKLSQLQGKAQKIFPELKLHSEMGNGPLESAILDYAAAKNIDLIVMGTQGASGLKKVLVGTNAARILEQTSIPLLLVPEQFEWVPPQNVVYCTDYQNEDLETLKIICRLTHLFQAAIALVHILENETSDVNEAEEKLCQYAADLKKLTGGTNFKCALITGPVAETLDHLQEKMDYDILVMVKRKKEWYEKWFKPSYTRHVAYLTDYPMLILPSKEYVANQN